MNDSLWDQTKISFRELKHEDLPLMHKWLNTQHVKHWWGKEGTSWEKVVEEYGAYIDGKEPTRAFLILYDKLPIGYIQAYLINDHPEYAKYLCLNFEAAAVDLFIGEEDYLHKGLGSVILRKFLQDVVFADKTVDYCIIGPDATNSIAIRAYEKAGFHYLKSVQVPDEENPEYWMVVSREEIV